MSQFENVVQLGEDIEVPDGYNCVEIFGTGDERKIGTFPLIKVTSSRSTMSSNGEETAAIFIKITSYAAINPFKYTIDKVEKVTPSDPFTLSTEKYILPGSLTIYEYNYEDVQNRQYTVPYDHIKGNKVHISDGWTPHRLPVYSPPVPGMSEWKGFFYAEAWVKYTTVESCTVSVGKKADDPYAPGYVPWWVAPEKQETLPENQCNGDFYDDSNGSTPNWTMTIPILGDISGSTVTLTTYFKPDTGDSGLAYIYGEYEGQDDFCTINVEAGGVGPGGGGNISLTADPSTITRQESSLITADVRSADGGWLLDQEILFTVTSGTGYCTPSRVRLGKVDNEIESVTSSPNTDVDPPVNTTFSLSKPVVKISSIVVDNDAAWAWNGRITIVGSQCYLVDQEFPQESTAISVTYDWGGRATTVYKPASYTTVGTVNRISAAIGRSNNNIAITIGDETASVYTLSLDAETPLRANPDPAPPDEPQTGLGQSIGWIKCIVTESVERASHQVDDDSALGWHWDVQPTIFDPPRYIGIGPVVRHSPAITATSSIPDAQATIEMSLPVEEDIVDEQAAINGQYTCSVQYPIAGDGDGVKSLTYNGTSYEVQYYDGNTIFIKDNSFTEQGFDDPGGTVLVSYTAGGICYGILRTNNTNKTYPGGGSEIPNSYPNNYNINLTARYGGNVESMTVVVGNAPADVDISVAAEPTTIEVGGVSLVTSTVTVAGQPLADVILTCELISGAGTLRAGNIVVDGLEVNNLDVIKAQIRTQNDGTASVEFVSDGISSGLARIIVSVDNGGKSPPVCEITVNPKDAGGRNITTKNLGSIVGGVNPLNNSHSLVASSGELWFENSPNSGLDAWGGTDGVPEPLSLRYKHTGVTNDSIRDISIVGTDDAAGATWERVDEQ